MTLEFLHQPPKKTGDIRLNYPPEQSQSEYVRDGLDLVWAQIGEADASRVFVNFVEHTNPAEKIDYELLREVLHDAAQVLDDAVRASYLVGVNKYIDALPKL